MRLPLADTHAHLNDGQFEADWQEAVERAKEAGVTQIIIPGSDYETSQRAVEQSEKYAGLFAAIGVHPHDAKTYSEEVRLRLIELSSHPKVVAIGEIGLDYYYNHSPREVQLAVFRDQMQVAAETGRVVIVHDREAHADTLQILEEYAGVVRGVLHCFSGSTEMARRCVELGYYIGFGGTLTFKNAKRPLEVAREVPLDRIVLETDSPYLAPVPHRGKRNEPAYVVEVFNKLAEIRGLSHAELRSQLNRNVAALFQIYAYNQ
ncbi:MAG: TatD family hydrolase [Firmicutes bacterium]|nr:TatD family hydrolase [Bacillota bacterium]